MPLAFTTISPVGETQVGSVLTTEFIVGELILIVALAVGSLLGTLSTTAFTLPVPGPVAVKITVAVQAGWMVVCAPDSVPSTAL